MMMITKRNAKNRLELSHSKTQSVRLSPFEPSIEIDTLYTLFENIKHDQLIEQTPLQLNHSE